MKKLSKTLTERTAIIAAASLVHVNVLHNDENEMSKTKEKLKERIPAVKRMRQCEASCCAIGALRR